MAKGAPALPPTDNADVLALTVRLNELANQPTHISGVGQLSIPFSGSIDAYISCLQTSVSSAGNKHVITLLRNGQPAFNSGLDTLANEIVEYREKFMGNIVHAGVGDVIAIDVAVTGTPSPLLSYLDFVIRLVLKPAR